MKLNITLFFFYYIKIIDNLSISLHSHRLEIFNQSWSPVTERVSPLFLTFKISGVASQVCKLNRLSSSTRAILASIRANLLPIQFLGPSPKGMYVISTILSLFSGANLSGSKVQGSVQKASSW